MTTAAANMNVGIAGLGAIGGAVASALHAGMPGLTLAAVAERDVELVRARLGNADLHAAGFVVPIS